MTAGNNRPRLDRRAAIRVLLDDRGEMLVVTGLGSTTYDAASVADDEHNFYLWGAMGGAAMVGLGLAIARPDRPVLVVTGDGDMLMGLGALATIGVQAPPNLAIAVFDNGRYAETGMQPSHTDSVVDLVGVARSCGIEAAVDITGKAALADFARRAQAKEKTLFARVAILADEPPRVLPSRDGVYLKTRFRRATGLSSAPHPTSADDALGVKAQRPDTTGKMRSDTPARHPVERPPGLSRPGPTYAVGLFGMGYGDLYNFLIPLYGLSLGMNASQVGLLVGGRSLLAVFLSIHIGVLMDRFGTRRVTLFFVWTAMLLAPVFPLLPWFWPLLVLQIINGAALNFAWSGAQTLIAQLAEGEAEYIGRFSFFARIGTAAAPIIAGVAWDFGGAWPAYGLGALWGVMLTAALLRAPEARERVPRAPGNFRLRELLPQVSDYASSFALMVIPAVFATMAIIFLRTATMGVQSSRYVVYQNRIGLVGTTNGLLFATVEIFSGLGHLFAGRAMRMGDPQWTMLSGTVISIAVICVTPFLGGIYALLVVANIVRGWLQGVVQPMMFSVQAKAVGPYRQGAVVGLRQTMNRLAAIVIPPIMGVIADGWGTTASFVTLGIFLALLCIPVARVSRRGAQLAAAEPAD